MFFWPEPIGVFFSGTDAFSVCYTYIKDRTGLIVQVDSDDEGGLLTLSVEKIEETACPLPEMIRPESSWSASVHWLFILYSILTELLTRAP